MMSKKTPAFAGAFLRGKRGLILSILTIRNKRKKRTRDLFKTAGIWKKVDFSGISLYDNCGFFYKSA